MKLCALLVVAAFVTTVSCDPSPAAKIDGVGEVGKRQAEFVQTTTPCSLSVYRYLFNKPGTKIRPNLPAGTVIFGKALPPADRNELEESGSKIDATELKPEADDSDVSNGYLPPDNNYLPPPPPPKIPSRPNYFQPINVPTSTVGTDDAVVISTPAPPPASFVPEFPSSSYPPPIDFDGPSTPVGIPEFPSVFPSPTPSPGLPIFSPSPSPAYPIFSPSPSPVYPINYPISPVGLDGTRCTCEDGRVIFTPNQYPGLPFYPKSPPQPLPIAPRFPLLPAPSHPPPPPPTAPAPPPPPPPSPPVFRYPSTPAPPPVFFSTVSPPPPFSLVKSPPPPPPPSPSVFQFST